jgi:hypothetical protein
MRRLVHWAFNGATAVSAVLFMATCVLWVRSCWARISFCHEFQDMTYGISPSKGKLLIWRGASFDPHDRPRHNFTWWATERDPESDAPEPFAYPDLSDLNSDVDGDGNIYIYKIFAAPPFWSIAVSSMLLPTLSAVQRWSCRIRRKVGLCPSCGYDLRATPRRCPECGIAPPQRV